MRVALVQLVDGEKTHTKTSWPRPHFSPRASFSVLEWSFSMQYYETGLRGRREFFISKQGKARANTSDLSWSLYTHYFWWLEI